MSYVHLSITELIFIEEYFNQNMSSRTIAKHLNRIHSCINRVLQKSQCGYSKSASLLSRNIPAASLLFQWELELPLKQGSSTHRLRGGGLPWEVKRLTRKSICFSKSQEIHDIVIGLVINILEFGWCVDLWKVHI